MKRLLSAGMTLKTALVGLPLAGEGVFALIKDSDVEMDRLVTLCRELNQNLEKPEI